MGNYALVLAAAGFLVLSTMMLNTRNATVGAQGPLEEHHFKSLAREASMTGLNWTVRRLVADTASWKTTLEANPDAYGTGGTPKEYHLATFTTRVLPRYGTAPPQDSCNPDTVDVVSTGRAHAGALHRHEVVATYVRTCSDPVGRPPFLDYATLADLRFDIDGEVRVWSADASTNADVHSNEVLWVTNPAIVEGFGSQSRPRGGGCTVGPCDTVFMPNDDTNGGDSNFLRGEPEIEVPFFDYTVWEPKATHRGGGDVGLRESGGDVVIDDDDDVTIDFTQTGYGTEDKPAVWFIDGDLYIGTKATVQILGHVMIVVKDGVLINNDARIISSAPAGEFPPPSTHGDPNHDEVRSWIAEHMADGTTMALNVAGCYEGNCDNEGIRANGKTTFIGQIFSNEEILINDESTTFGAIVTRGQMRYNAKNTIWYLGASESLFGDGGEVVVPDGVRLLSMVEF